MMHFLDGHLQTVVLGCCFSCGRVCDHPAYESGQLQSTLDAIKFVQAQRGPGILQEQLQGVACHAICMKLCRHAPAACFLSLDNSLLP